MVIAGYSSPGDVSLGQAELVPGSRLSRAIEFGPQRKTRETAGKGRGSGLEARLPLHENPGSKSWNRAVTRTKTQSRSGQLWGQVSCSEEKTTPGLSPSRPSNAEPSYVAPELDGGLGRHTFVLRCFHDSCYLDTAGR